jgi:serine/threonine-protein phosphatase with EF-hands
VTTPIGKFLQCTACFFSSLPLCTLIGNDKKGDKICVLHGGLSKQVTIKRLENVDRMKFSSIMHTALVLNGSEKLSSGETINYDQATTIVGCTWSDPQNQDGLKFNVKRGCGVFFGPDITAKFLKDHKLNLLIRSHECLEDGYRLSHNDKLCTVFSASDYYGPESNLGAYIRVDANLKPHYFTFAGYLERKNLPSRSAVDYAAMENVHAVIVKKKKQLLNAFKSADKGNTKRLSVHEWCNCMEQVTELFLPWRSLLPVRFPHTHTHTHIYIPRQIVLNVTFYNYRY